MIVALTGLLVGKRHVWTGEADFTQREMRLLMEYNVVSPIQVAKSAQYQVLSIRDFSAIHPERLDQRV
jgi:hypothetical protein